MTRVQQRTGTGSEGGSPRSARPSRHRRAGQRDGVVRRGLPCTASLPAGPDTECPGRGNYPARLTKGTPIMDRSALAEEYRRVIACAECARCGECAGRVLRDDLFDLPQPGYVGAAYDSSRVLLLGQNPGVSPDRYREQDRRYADALVRLREAPGEVALARLQALLEAMIPSWPVAGRHFPLAECGLGLRQIAHFNVVRCRTPDNAPPCPAVTARCVGLHFARWLELLAPRVVVCIGKRAHDQAGHLLAARGIPHAFVSRRRDLPAAERAANRAAVVALVRSALAREEA